jgi:hypothetical protein
VLRVTFPHGEIGREIGAIFTLTDRDGVLTDGGRAGAAEARLSWAYADDAANDAQPRDPDVDIAVATQFAARARQEAVRLNRAGDYRAARAVLDATGRRIRGYAGRNLKLREVVGELESEGERFSAPMPAMALKDAHFASANLARSRDSFGRSRKER